MLELTKMQTTNEFVEFICLVKEWQSVWPRPYGLNIRFFYT